MKTLMRRLLYPDSSWAMLFLGLAFGAIAVSLSLAGNPANTGICVSCFLVNIAGSLGLHGSSLSSYMRPEIVAFVIGSFLAAFSTKEFSARGSSLAPVKFLGGAFLIFGCEVFIGCPIKMLLRISAGGLTAVVGFLGLGSGVYLGSLFLRDGFSPFKERQMPEISGALVPLLSLIILFVSTSGIYAFAAGVLGSSARHAPFALSLGFGLIVGVIGQRSRYCITGAMKNLFLGRVVRDFLVVVGFLAASTLLLLFTGGFSPTYLFEAGAHTNLTWAFLSLAMVGLGSILIGGCPFRQLILAGTGDLDASSAVAGMLAGAALSVSLGISSSAAGVTQNGKLAVLSGWIFFLLLGLMGKTKRFQGTRG